jgi:protein-S-isoprenylcysteine O-methyltransferase Ste14
VIPPLLARIHAEEALLREHFGEEYDAYRMAHARVPFGRGTEVEIRPTFGQR